MKKPSLAAPLLVLLLAIPSPVLAEANLDQLLALSMDELLSLKIRISTNTSQSLSKAPSVVSVITAEDIKATGAANLAEILQSVPGLYVRANLFGFRPQMTFRGAAGTHTLLMVNGAPLRDLVWSTGIFWKGLPTSMIERVEIIRGPGSALFGSDASAGVINVITRTAGRIGHSEAGLRAGSFDSQAAWLRHGGEWMGIDFGLTAELSHTDGHDPFIAVDGQTAQDAAAGTSVSYAPGHARYGWDGRDLRFSAARGPWRLLADYLGHDNLETGLAGAGVLDPVTRGKDHRLDLALLYNNEEFSRDWGLNAELRYHHLGYSSGDGFQERPPGYVATAGGTPYVEGVLNRARSAQRGYSIEASGLYTGVRKHALRIGAGYNLEDLYRVEHFTNLGKGPDGIPLPANSPLVEVSNSPYAFAPEKTRSIRYFYLQDIWSFADDWELTAGARYDDYSDFGGTLNPRLALVWQSTDRLTTKLMYGKAFRAPSYLELYAVTTANNPNPDLTPERTDTWDLSFTYSATPNLKLGLDIYTFSQSNLIAADAAKTFQNNGNRTTHGMELEAHWQATRTFRTSANLTHIKENESTFPRSIPKNKAYLRTDWAFLPNWNWNLQANWIGKRPLPAGDARAPLNSYTTLDTTIRHILRPKFEFAISLRNLFDVDAREYTSSAITENLPLPGRTLYTEVIYKF